MKYLNQVRDLNIRKVFIADTEDGLLDLEILKEDAVRGKFEFQAIPNASHFVMMDEGEEVEKVIKGFKSNWI